MTRPPVRAGRAPATSASQAPSAAGAAPLRVGWFPYLNCAPLRWAVRRLDPAAAGAVAEVAAPPVPMLQALLDGAVDVAPVSLIEYLRHSASLRQLPGIAIGSTGPIRSCQLLSRCDLRRLHGQPVALSSASRTTSAMTALVLQRQLGVRPRWRISRRQLPELLDGVSAAMVIGDEALAAWASPPRGWQPHDVAELWQDWTGLPAVFAVWATRRDTPPTAALEHWQDLLARSAEALAELGGPLGDVLVAACLPHSPVSAAATGEYLSGLDYRCGQQQSAAMGRLAELAGIPGHSHPGSDGEVTGDPAHRAFQAAAGAVVR